MTLMWMGLRLTYDVYKYSMRVIHSPFSILAGSCHGILETHVTYHHHHQQQQQQNSNNSLTIGLPHAQFDRVVQANRKFGQSFWRQTRTDFRL